MQASKDERSGHAGQSEPGDQQHIARARVIERVLTGQSKQVPKTDQIRVAPSGRSTVLNKPVSDRNDRRGTNNSSGGSGRRDRAERASRVSHSGNRQDERSVQRDLGVRQARDAEQHSSQQVSPLGESAVTPKKETERHPLNLDAIAEGPIVFAAP